ncbi:hypothetical protein DFH07DRAFT_828692, partial [Mycena maculata]
TYAATGQVQIAPDYMNAVAYTTQPAPLDSGTTFGATESNLTFPDYASMYAATGQVQNNGLPPFEDRSPTRPNIHLPFSQFDLFMGQGAMYSPPYFPEHPYTLPHNNMHVQLMPALPSDLHYDLTYGATGQVQNPVLPPFEGLYPTQPDIYFPFSQSGPFMEQGAMYSPLYLPEQQLYTLPRNNMHAQFMPDLPSDLPAFPAPSPPQTRSPRARASAVSSRKRAAVERELGADPKRQKLSALEKLYPKASECLSTFAVHLPARRSAAAERNVPGPSTSPQQCNSLPPPAKPTPRGTGRQRGPANHPLVLFAVPPEGIPDAVDERSLTEPLVNVDDNNKYIRLDRMVFGPENMPANRFQPGRSWAFSLIGGPALAALREKEGSSFYGNELYNPYTRTRFVLRITDKEQNLPRHGIPLDHLDLRLEELLPAPDAAVHTLSPSPSTDELDKHEAQASTPLASNFSEVPVAGTLHTEPVPDESSPPCTPELDIHNGSGGSTPVTSGPSTPRSIQQTLPAAAPLTHCSGFSD